MSSYAFLSTIILWPVFRHGVRTSSVLPQEDTSIYVWTNGWVAHAFSHLENPFFSTYLFHPLGINLVSNNDSWILAALFSPLTWIAGPLASMNAELWLGPVVSALVMAVAVGRVTSSRWSQWCAGLVWGFSPFVIRAMAYGWTNLVWLIFPPLVFYVGWRLFVDHDISPRRAGLVLSVATVAELLLSGEILAITALATLIALVLLFIVGWRKNRSATKGAARTAVTSAVWSLPGLVLLGAVPAYYVLLGPARLANWVYPESTERLNSYPLARLVTQPVTYTGTIVGRLALLDDSYLGIALVLALLTVVIVLYRRSLAWLIVAWAIFGVWCACSTHLPIGIFELFWRLPFVRNITPHRMIIVTWFAAALLVALGVEDVQRRWSSRRSSASLIAALLVAGGIQVGIAIATSLPIVALGTSSDVALRVPSSTHPLSVITFPAPRSSRSMMQQATEGFRFYIPGGYGPQLTNGDPVTQAGYDELTRLSSFILVAPTAPTRADLLHLQRAYRHWGVQRVVMPITRCVDEKCVSGDPSFVISATTELWGRPRVIAGEWVWRPRSTLGPIVSQSRWSACTSIETRPRDIPACIAAPVATGAFSAHGQRSS